MLKAKTIVLKKWVEINKKLETWVVGKSSKANQTHTTIYIVSQSLILTGNRPKKIVQDSNNINEPYYRCRFLPKRNNKKWKRIILILHFFYLSDVYDQRHRAREMHVWDLRSFSHFWIRCWSRSRRRDLARPRERASSGTRGTSATASGPSQPAKQNKKLRLLD